MRWFEHHTDDRDQAHAKIIRSRFGAEGYGIYMSLLEVIGQNVLEDNQEEWGQVASIHDIQSLAKECSVTPAKLKKFLLFCNEKNIFSKKSGKLFTDLITKRLDIYAKRIKSKSKMFEVTSKSVRSKVEVDSTLHIQTQIQKQIIDKSIGSVEPKAEILKENKKNKCVDHAIAEFTRVYKFQPTDKKVRNVAYNLVQKMETVIKTRLGGEATPERVMTGITRLFDWISHNESFSNIQKLETTKLKMSIWEANLKGTYAANERQNHSGESEQTPSSPLGGKTRDVLRRDRLPDSGKDRVLHPSLPSNAATRTSGGFEGMGQILQKFENEGRDETERTRPDGVGELRLGDSIQNAQGGIEQTLEPTGFNGGKL